MKLINIGFGNLSAQGGWWPSSAPTLRRSSVW